MSFRSISRDDPHPEWAHCDEMTRRCLEDREHRHHLESKIIRQNEIFLSELRPDPPKPEPKPEPEPEPVFLACTPTKEPEEEEEKPKEEEFPAVIRVGGFPLRRWAFDGTYHRVVGRESEGLPIYRLGNRTLLGVVPIPSVGLHFVDGNWQFASGGQVLYAKTSSTELFGDFCEDGVWVERDENVFKDPPPSLMWAWLAALVLVYLLVRLFVCC